MTILHVELRAPILTADEELELARRIEAGVYAEHLLSSGSLHPRTQLEDIRRRGRVAWDELWSRNLRLVMKYAMEFARRHLLPVDDLFQDGCLGLGEAMQRFDHARGLRFSTLALRYVRHAVASSAARRCGAVEGPLHRQRIRRLMRRAGTGSGPAATLQEQARLAGVSAEMAVASNVRLVGIDELQPAQMATSGDFEAVESFGTDFLDLLEEPVAAFLRLRYGIGCAALPVHELARALRISPSSVRRVETQALELARRLLDQEQCVLPATSVRIPQLAA